MKKLNTSEVIEKKSKFIGYLYEIDNIEEVSLILEELKKEHKKANEDKEPSNTAGKPILDIINYNNLNNTLIVVVRYFGGTLLGRGLLTRTYSKTARLLIEK